MSIKLTVGTRQKSSKEESRRGKDLDLPLIEEEPNSKVRVKKIKDSTPTVLNCKVNNNNIHKYYNAI